MGVVNGGEVMQEPVSCEEKIFVSVRLRPLNEKEIARHDVSDWECINDNTIKHRNNLSVSERSLHPTANRFDRVFSSDCPNRQVYEEGAKEVALSVVSGINSSVFAYGQTSSGKTYTMTGITEYAMADIYDHIQKHKERDFILKFSAMEIYNESVKDLLSVGSAPLRLLDDPERGTVVEKFTEETLQDSNHFKELLSVCKGETSLNERSSRSHQILRVTVESSAREILGNDKSSTLVATVNLVDLAGSERAPQTLSGGARLKEGSHINRSLLTLGTVIRKLSKGRNGHIPFRDSKLTRILQSSLGGNARTAIICTMSPARTHAEQSRNTLLFANYAKEVITKAQVNVVMSNKTLVKQLQREMTSVDNDSRSPGRTSIFSDSDALLRERDLEIEKLKKEVTILTQERDHAWSVVKGLQQAANNESLREEKLGEICVGSDSHYPKLRVRDSQEFENPITVRPVLSVRVRSCTPSDTQSFSSEESFIQLPDFKLTIAHSGASSPQLSPRIPVFVASTLCHEESSDESSDLLCKEVPCIDSKSSMNRYPDWSFSESCPKNYENYNMSSPRETTSVSGVMEVENEDISKQESKSFLLNKNASPEKTYLWQLKDDTCKSCKASLMTGLTTQWMEREEKEEGISPVRNTKAFFARPFNFHRKFSAWKFENQSEGLSRKRSQNSSTSTTVNKLNAQRSTNESQSYPKSAAGDYAVMEPIFHDWTVKDVGLDPIPDTYGSPSAWPSEFKRLQREIIELWHACNVPLVHKTYFFLLFKGDPKDYIYMEVEHKRMTYLKNAFSHGNKMVGRVLTLASSVNALRRERQMLSQRMSKRLSNVERENMFLKWGIELNMKQRRLKLAQLLWSDCKDMEHIAESATVVAKLVDFVNPEKTFKEMFGLNFTPGQRVPKTNNTLKRNLMYRV